MKRYLFCLITLLSALFCFDYSAYAFLGSFTNPMLKVAQSAKFEFSKGETLKSALEENPYIKTFEWGIFENKDGKSFVYFEGVLDTDKYLDFRSRTDPKFITFYKEKIYAKDSSYHGKIISFRLYFTVRDDKAVELAHAQLLIDEENYKDINSRLVKLKDFYEDILPSSIGGEFLRALGSFIIDDYIISEGENLKKTFYMLTGDNKLIQTDEEMQDYKYMYLGFDYSIIYFRIDSISPKKLLGFVEFPSFPEQLEEDMKNLGNAKLFYLEGDFQVHSKLVLYEEEFDSLYFRITFNHGNEYYVYFDIFPYNTLPRYYNSRVFISFHSKPFEVDGSMYHTPIFSSNWIYMAIAFGGLEYLCEEMDKRYLKSIGYNGEVFDKGTFSMYSYHRVKALGQSLFNVFIIPTCIRISGFFLVFCYIMASYISR